MSPVLKSLRSLELVSACALLLAHSPLAAQSADDLRRLDELDAACTKARDDSLQEVRRQKVNECMRQAPEARAEPKSREECEKYWSDFGSTTGGASGSRGNYLSSDVPECVRAFEARQRYRAP